MHNGPTLTVDLAALCDNWQLLKKRFGGGECTAVVKSDAYGLGVEQASKALAARGCNTFFVATLDEAIELRGILPQAAVYAFHGPYAGEEKDYLHHRITPVINSVEQLKRWNNAAPFALHVDTGMNRLGLTLSELAAAKARPALLMSHLACANEPAHLKNAEQLARFREARALLPGVPASLCNSSGIFLSGDFHFDLARPGCSLYGINPTGGPNPMHPVATLSAPIIMLRTADRDGTVGYGATHAIRKGDRIAIVQLGYADGYLRALSNRGRAFLNGQAVPVIGRISMDMIAVDVNALAENAAVPGSRVELLNAKVTVDEAAQAAGTIGYEVLTRLGPRVKREYRP